MRERQIAVIATLIGQMHQVDFDPGWCRDEAARDINDGPGWTIDVIYGHEAPGSWTRTEGIVLTSAELRRAIDLADQMETDTWARMWA